MTMFLMIIGSLLVAGGQFFLKRALGIVVIADKNILQMFEALFVGLLTPKAFAALLLTGLGSFVYFMALRLGTISTVVPITASLIIAITALIGCVVMKDPMPVAKIAGLLLIVGGVYFVSRPA